MSKTLNQLWSVPARVEFAEGVALDMYTERYFTPLSANLLSLTHWHGLILTPGW